MAGIGDYKKGGKFTLKSGNSPSFQEIGSSPLQKTDVYMDGKNIGTGYKARKKSIDKSIKDTKKISKSDDPSKVKKTKITYTGKDKKVMESDKGKREHWQGEQRANPGLKKYPSREAWLKVRKNKGGGKKIGK